MAVRLGRCPEKIGALTLWKFPIACIRKGLPAKARNTPVELSSLAAHLLKYKGTVQKLGSVLARAERYQERFHPLLALKYSASEVRSEAVRLNRSTHSRVSLLLGSSVIGLFTAFIAGNMTDSMPENIFSFAVKTSSIVGIGISMNLLFNSLPGSMRFYDWLMRARGEKPIKWY